jgi:valyl-tRNA synthetase
MPFVKATGMDKTYNPSTIEQHWYQQWERDNLFQPNGANSPFCIMLPPPNVTGSLHMGHGFQQTLMDVLMRYHRMLGHDSLWQVGTDHAGIATQMVVERRLQQAGQNRHELGREKFVEKVWQWKQESGNTITHQMRRLGVSAHWPTERFTMDPGFCQAVNQAFIQLYDEGLIYRGQRLVNWDPLLLTAVSDLEVIAEEEIGSLWHIRYPLVDNSGFVVVATTRPETLLGDMAVAVNPTDPRYKYLVGKQLQLPLGERTIPIIADSYVDPEFGTGCVKITPAHDFNDYAIGQRHQLPLLNILTPDAKLNDKVPKAYQGLDRFAARTQVIADLTAQGLLEKTEKHSLKVPRGDRSGAIIEPYLTSQWYVKMESLAAPAVSAVKEGQVKFVPENWSKTYFQWLENIQDWCISRQLWWGHRIPAWYDENHNIYVGHSLEEVRQKYQLDSSLNLRQDDDVLDTWFSAALWPFATLGWPNQTAALERYYPTNVLVTGFDIIFFWVARMVMFGLKFTGQVPFHTVYMTGLIRDSEGQKMSKTKGNVLDPLDIIDGIALEELVEKRTYGLMQPKMAERIAKQTRQEFPEGIAAFGTDALRFSYCALATTGRDIKFDLGRVEGYRNFCNKIWNATRFVLMNTQEHDTGSHATKLELNTIDKWIYSRLQDTIAKVTQYLANYRFDLLAQTIYEFVWDEFCDWYLELAKPILFSKDNPQAQLATRHTLINVLETTLRLIHPIMPFMSEEIWQQVGPLSGKQGVSIMLQKFPSLDIKSIDKEAEAEVAWLKQIVLTIRNIRGEMNVSPAKTIDLLLRKGSVIDKNRLQAQQPSIQHLARISHIAWLEDEATMPPSATGVVGELEILLPMAGLIDKAAEISRLDKELAKLNKEVSTAQAKLANPNFTEKAPKDVVSKEQNLLAEKEALLAKLNEKLLWVQGL